MTTPIPDDADEYNRDERIETYYQGWSARDMAERIVDLEDELGDDVDGICTGMHADVAEAHAEIERLTKALAEAQLDVGYFQEWAEFNGRRLNDWIAWQRRYRSAWLSARRRAADEANFATEALTLKDAEISRLTARLDAIRAYADSRVAHPNANEASASWVLHLLDD
ncbi:hypothetical protein [Streptomyces scopuliridis]|uniref:hypothetical protein n=1 Tax=Streptomyces scopuliridis TaxID=452529 RepID=UPI003446CDF1